MSESAQKPLIIFIYFALILSTLLVFWQVRNFDFVNYDDGSYVYQNPHVLNGLTYSSFIWAFTTGHTGYWHPLTWLSLMLDCRLFGPDPGPIHLVSLLLHVANTLLLFTILKKMTAALWPSAFVAAAFAIHPMHVESVAWIAERKDVLSTFFWLLTLAAYVGYVKRPGLFRYLLTILLFALALLAKPMVVTLPFVLLLLDYWPLNRFEPQTVSPQIHSGGQYRLLIEKIPFFVLAAVLSVATFLFQRSGGVMADINALPFRDRAANALLSYATYMGKMFWPQNLAVFYPLEAGSVTLWQVVLCVLLLLVISFFVIYFGRTRRYLPVGWFWFVGTLIPVIGLIQVGAQSLADRYTYIPFVGLFIMIAWGLPDLLRAARPVGARHAVPVAAAGVIALTALALSAYRQVSYWKNSFTLFSHTIEVTQNNYVTYINLGVAYANLGGYQKAMEAFRQAVKIKPNCAEALYNLGNAYGNLGRYPDAIEACKQAVKIKPNYAEAHYNLGNAYENQGRYPDAIEGYRQAIRIKPDYAEAHYNLGLAYGNQGRFPEAIEAYRQAIKIKPDYAEAYNNLGAACGELGRYPEEIEACKQAIRIKPDYVDAHSNLSVAYGELGRYPEQIEVCKQVIKIKPDDAEAHIYLGSAYGNLGRYPEAIEAFRQAIRIKPDYAEAHYDLAVVLRQQGRLEQALDQLRAAVRLKSDWPAPMNDLAVLMAYYPDLKGRDVNEGVRLAGRACELTDYRDPGYLDTLAAAYASAGRFPDAIDTAQKALKLAAQTNQPQIKDMIQYHLNFYTQNQPYIESLPQPPPEPNKP